MDPHTAVGKRVCDKYLFETGDPTKTVILSTASPFKFGRDVARALLGDDDRAEQLYLEAIERLSRTRIYIELARTHLVYGEWLRRRNRRVDARAQLRTAHEMFASMGAEAFAERARRQGRRCSSIVGPADATSALWALLERSWGPAREVRGHQPLMATSTPVTDVEPDPLVRRVHRGEIEALIPACVAMFTEEVGISPLAGDGGLLYQARVAELVSSGRSFARFDEDGKVVFKAEIGAVTAGACQIQGVWVAPEHRGKRLSESGMAAIVNTALAEVAPVVSLYVNDFNLRARAAYRRVGFQEVGAFMSVLF